ncbi:TetR family transcriptional regulator [Streptomyces sp. NPDC051776]|uniref:TetR/AcrR family transcriptional regulator n=1 Tax=Streptomyces sp. NPDC051776 TaxID=3155414 RepID=UPI0034364986
MTRMAPAHTSPGAVSGPELGLRERKKIKTRQAIRHAAYRLFTEQGYDATPVEQIADAAEVSPSTVFRYFPTKEDIVLTDEYDPIMENELRNRPPGEPPLVSIRHVMTQTVRAFVAHEQEETVLRARLLRDVPAIRARMSESNVVTGRMLCGVLAGRTGRPADDLELRVFTASVLAAVEETMFHWIEGGAREDLAELLNRALDMLGRGLAL